MNITNRIYIIYKTTHRRDFGPPISVGPKRFAMNGFIITEKEYKEIQEKFDENMKQVAEIGTGIKAMMLEIQKLNDKLNFIKLMAKMPETVTISDIAKYEHLKNPETIYHKKHLLPRFGESAFKEGKKRWPFEEYIEWRAIPEDERLRMMKEARN